MKAGTFLLEWDKIGALWVKLDEEKVDQAEFEHFSFNSNPLLIFQFI